MNTNLNKAKYNVYVRKTREKSRKMTIPCYTVHTVFACVIFLLVMCIALYVIAYGFKTKSSLTEGSLYEANLLAEELARREEELSGAIIDEKNRIEKLEDEIAKAYEDRIKYYEEKTAEFQRRIDELEAAKEDLSMKISSTISSHDSVDEAGEVLAAVYEPDALGGPAEGDYLEFVYMELETHLKAQEEDYSSMLEYVYSSVINEEGLRFALSNGIKRENIPTIWPLTGRITSWVGARQNPFGGAGTEGHNGIDIAVGTGTPVKAAGGGVVKHAGLMGGYGYLVVIDHGGGLESYYGHNSKLMVTEGQQISRGQTISLSGNTGRSTGPHLHFEIRFKNNVKDPLDFVKA